MQNFRKQYLVRASGALLLLAAACGGDDSSSSGQSVSTAGTTAGTSASAGHSGSTASTSTAGKSASAGSAASTTTTAGKGGTAAPSGSAGHTAADEDAGVSHDAGTATTAGTGASAGSGAAGHAGGAAAGSGGSSSASGATFTQVYALFKTGCAVANCHVGARAGDALAMDDQATAYKNLVDAKSVSCAGAKRVVAGDPTMSELVNTLQHTMVAGCARTPRMPDNKPMLAAADIDLVVAWIKAGAKND